MSDTNPITPEMVDAAKTRDSRIRLIGEALAIQADMRDNETIKYILRQITTDADRAMEELAEVSPLDSSEVARLLVKIKTLVYIRTSLETLKRRAELAAVEIRLEEESTLDERY